MEEIILTPYEEEKFKHLDNLVIGKSYKYDPNRSDISEFLITLDKYSHIWFNCLQIDREACIFKRVWPQSTIEYCKQHNIEL